MKSNESLSTPKSLNTEKPATAIQLFLDKQISKNLAASEELKSPLDGKGQGNYFKKLLTSQNSKGSTPK